MAARARRRPGGGGGHDGPDERWLLTYSDMITLLMALFIVMWSMSTVNISRFAALKASLREAFNGKLAEGGASIQNGAPGLLPEQSNIVAPPETKPIAFQPVKALPDPMESGEQQDLENLLRLKRELDAYAAASGLKAKVRSDIDERGLVVRVLTDDLLFDSGEAVLRDVALPVLTRIATLLRDASRVPNPVRVEGNTDDRPISTSRFRSNWELSTARATAVLQVLLQRGLDPRRASVAGYADQHPIASNATARGRSLNRRVELVVIRRSLAAAQGGATAR
jgi:chemotaxis protein MotB